MEAVARKFVRHDIIPDFAGLCGLGQQASDHVVDLLLRSGDVHTSMQDRLCGDECEGHAQHGMEHCRICAEACRRCESACNNLLSVIGA